MPDLTDKIYGFTLLGVGLSGVATSGLSFFNLYENIKNFDDVIKQSVYTALNVLEGGAGTVLLAAGIYALVKGYRVFYPEQVVAQTKAVVAKPAALAQLAK
jgi:hypothetical protein